MKLRRYCVTVTDNWTPTRLFWTKTGALMWLARFPAGAHVYTWAKGEWREMGLSLRRR